MDALTPITIVTAKYSERDTARTDFDALWNGRSDKSCDHTALAILLPNATGKLRIERYESSANHLSWGGSLLGAALVLVAPPVGARFLTTAVNVGGIGAVVGHLYESVPRTVLATASNVLHEVPSGLIVMAVNRRGEDVGSHLGGALEIATADATWGELDTELETEIALAQVDPSGM